MGDMPNATDITRLKMNSFCVGGVNGWNDLVEAIVQSKTVQKFKTSYDKHMGNL